MIRFGADEDFDNHILRGLRHRSPSIDIVRAQDELGRGASDADVLDLVPQVLGIGAAIDDLVLIAECSAPEEWTGQVRFLPLR